MSLISELNDNEILEFLMSSDLEDDFSPSEYKYLLNKWKYFYRIKESKSRREEQMLEEKIYKLENDLKLSEAKVKNLIKKNSENIDLISSLKNRKLSFKERVKGKIIIKDENK